MKLVNADALKDALFQKHVHDGEELEPMLYLDDAVKVVDEAPAVDAIPVEWLNQKYAENEPGEDKDYDYFLWDAIAYILTEWQKEQEAR